MARMIPPVVHPGCGSPGEVDVFERLRDDPSTGEWIVLHSLDVSNHRQMTSAMISVRSNCYDFGSLK
ncbi:MAG: hypothetical protein ACYC5F_05970 [Thermoleophilia bacterium]